MADPPKLTGPGQIALAARSRAGPLWRVHRPGVIPLSPAVVAIVGVDEAALIEPRADPLTDGSGAVAPGRLVVRAAEMQGSARFVIGGAAPARPGRYTSTLRLAAGEDTLAIPVTIDVAAHSAWGVGLMLLGLACVGLITVMSTETTLHDRRAETLAARRALDEQLEQAPPPRRMLADIAAIDREYDAALAALSAPMPVSFADRRLDDASPHLAAAASMTADLRKALSGHAPGEAEIADLLAAWTSYTDIVADLARKVPAMPASGPAAVVPARDLGPLVDGYQARLARRFMSTRLDYDHNQLDQVMLGVRLAVAAGREAEAHARAEAARTWIEHGADDLARARELIETSILLGARMLADANQVDQAMRAEALPPDAVAHLSDLLDSAARALAHPTPTDTDDSLNFAQANRLVQTAVVDLARARAAKTQAEFTAKLQEANAAYSIDDINRAIEHERSQPHDQPAQRIASLQRIMVVWQVKLDAMPDQAERPRLQADADAINAALDRNDLAATPAQVRTLFNDWTALSLRYIHTRTEAVLEPGCERDKAATSTRIIQVNETLRQMPPRAELTEWRNRLASIAADLEAFDPAGDFGEQYCGATLAAITNRLTGLESDIFAAEASDARVAPAARLAALRQGGLGTMPAPARKLALIVETPESDRLLQRELRFSLADPDPIWNESNLVRVDFADGAAMTATLHDILHGRTITHRYARPPTSPLRVTVVRATEASDAPAERLGEGMLVLTLPPSPVLTARTIADGFFNARFALALAVAGTIYAWRFHSGHKVFGENGFDYVEAFALGFVVNAAVSDFPVELARLAG